jgi:hypothetical protein
MDSDGYQHHPEAASTSAPDQLTRPPTQQPGAAWQPGGPAPGPQASRVIASPEEPQAGSHARRRRRRRGVIGFITDKGIPLLIAVLGLLAALAGTWGALATADASDLEDTNASLERQIEILDGENDALGEEIEALTADRDRWKERAEGAPTGSPDTPDDGGTTTPPPTTGPSGDDSTVLRQSGTSPIVFSSSYSIDLDSDAPDWDVSDTSGAGWDLYFYTSPSSGPQLSTREVSLVDHVPTEAECDDATVLQAQLPREETRQGVQMCMRTTEDRLAYVHIASIDEDAETIAVDVIVWE